MADLIGQCLGQYEILALLGKGGMAAVYRARQLTIKREVAIKVIKPDVAESDGLARRLEREAEMMASLNHRHIAKLFDYGQQDDVIYLVMELLTGGSLADLIKHGPVPLARTSRILGEIASALDFAHHRGIIHRDLKPQNVLFDEDGSAILTDFGLAKLLHDSTVLTQSGAVTGTPAYMAPEQWRGEGLDARTDVYALGNIVFEMVTGRPPFVGETLFTMLHLHVNEPPPPIRDPDVPVGIERVVHKALAKDPASRFESASGMAKAFDAALNNQPAPALAASARGKARERVARRRAARSVRPGQQQNWRAPLLVIGVAVLGLLTVVVGLLSRGTPTTLTVTPAVTSASALVPTYTAPPGQPTRNAVRGPTATLEATPRPPGVPLKGDVLAYCDNPTNGEPRKAFPDDTPITVYWSWFAKTSEQIQSHLDNAEYEVHVDGRLLSNWRAFGTDVLRVRDRYFVYWYVPIGNPTPGEHRIDYTVSWKQQITDGFKTFGPGGQVEAETGTCIFNIG